MTDILVTLGLLFFTVYVVKRVFLRKRFDMKMTVGDSILIDGSYQGISGQFLADIATDLALGPGTVIGLTNTGQRKPKVDILGSVDSGTRQKIRNSIFSRF